MTMWGTLPEVFDRACLYYAERTAIRDGDRAVSYRQMQQWANRVANGLGALGVAPRERVGLPLPNALEFIPTQHRVSKAGAGLVEVPTRAPPAPPRTGVARGLLGAASPLALRQPPLPGRAPPRPAAGPRRRRVARGDRSLPRHRHGRRPDDHLPAAGPPTAFGGRPVLAPNDDLRR